MRTAEKPYFERFSGIEKDIFGSFAYDFELSQKLIFG